MLLFSEQEFAAGGHGNLDADSIVMVTSRQAARGSPRRETVPILRCRAGCVILARHSGSMFGCSKRFGHAPCAPGNWVMDVSQPFHQKSVMSRLRMPCV